MMHYQQFKLQADLLGSFDANEVKLADVNMIGVDNTASSRPSSPSWARSRSASSWASRGPWCPTWTTRSATPPRP